MPLNAQAEMGRVLAIEPEASQADALRQFVRDELGAELMLVSSAYAAVVAINRQTPDVVLFSESVSEKHRDRVLDHLRSTIAPATPQRLTMPSLRHCDRSALAQPDSDARGPGPGSAASKRGGRRRACRRPPSPPHRPAAPRAPIATTPTISQPVDEEFALPPLELSTTSAPETRSTSSPTI